MIFEYSHGEGEVEEYELKILLSVLFQDNCAFLTAIGRGLSNEKVRMIAMTNV